MSRRMNWREPYRDRDPVRTDVSKELLPRHLAPTSSRAAACTSEMTHEERLDLLVEEVAVQLRRIETRLAAWQDPTMKVPDHVRASSVAALDRRRAIGENILQRIDRCLTQDGTPGGVRRAYFEVYFEHSAFLAPL